MVRVAAGDQGRPELPLPVGRLGQRAPGHDPTPGQRQFQRAGRAGRDDDAAADRQQPVDRPGHRRRVAADDEDVEVGGDRGGQRVEPLVGKARHQPGRHPPPAAVHQRGVQVTGGRGPFLQARDDRAHQPDHRVRRSGRQGEVVGPGPPATGQPRGRRREGTAPGYLGHGDQQAPVAGGDATPGDDQFRTRLAQVAEHADVGPAARRDAAQRAVQTEVGGRVQARHPVGVHRRHAALERHPQGVVHEAVGLDERGHGAIAGQHEPRGQRRRRLERVEQPGEVGAERGLPQHHADPLPGAAQDLLGRDRLVVRREAGGGDGRHPLGGGAGGVALDAPAGGPGQGQARQHVRPPGPGIRPARDLADRDRPRVGDGAGQVAPAEAVGLVGAPRLRVGPDHPVELERRAGQRVGGEAKRPEPSELPDLQRVGDDARRPERQDVAGQRGGRHQVRGVDVRVDVARHQHPAGRVDHLGPPAHHVAARAHVGDALALDGDVGRVEFAGVDVQQRPAADVEVGRGLTTRHRGQRPPVGDRHGPDYRIRMRP